jgi:hypothetical protein
MSALQQLSLGPHPAESIVLETDRLTCPALIYKTAAARSGESQHAHRRRFRIGAELAALVRDCVEELRPPSRNALDALSPVARFAGVVLILFVSAPQNQLRYALTNSCSTESPVFPLPITTELHTPGSAVAEWVCAGGVCGLCWWVMAIGIADGMYIGSHRAAG